MAAVSPPPLDLCAYTPPVSLWALVETHVHESERDEIKEMLGCSLVEQSLELHQEVDMLLEIWRDYRDETEDSSYNRLPEPPDLRDRLVQEIRFFIDNIQEKARKNGRNPADVFTQHNRNVINYVMTDSSRPSSSCSRPSTALSFSDGRQTPMRNYSSLGSDGMSYGSSLSEEIESMTDKLNYLKLDETQQHLRQTLEDEVHTLLGDIKFLQGCLEEEADYRCESREDHTPSIADLREERSKLEHDLLTSPDLPKTKTRTSFSPTENLRKRNPLPTMRKISPPKSANNNNIKSGPMKASHTIAATSPYLNNDASSPSTQRIVASSGIRSKSPGSHIRVESPKHVTLRTTSTAAGSSSCKTTSPAPTPSSHEPTPPANKPRIMRPGSAERFRRMVIDSRDGT